MKTPAARCTADPRRRPSASTLALLALVIATATGFGAAGKAVEKVKQGISLFRSGDFEAAGKVFADADVARPDDVSIAFNRGCVCAARNDLGKAREFFRQAALSREPKLSVRGHYNLGCLAAQDARTTFGEKPIRASAEQRREGLALLAAAVGHYRDCLRLDSEHADARHNLEIIRLWIKQMQALWQEQDREKARSEMNLLEFLAMLEARQIELHAVTKLLGTEPDSPKRRQTQEETATSQRDLAEEIKPLKQKIEAQLKPPPSAKSPAAGSPPAAGTNADLDKARELLTRLADEAGRAMLAAADRIGDDAFDKASESQEQALDRLNQIFMAVAPFANVVQKALTVQQSLVEESTALTEQTEDHPDVDFEDLAWNQSRVTEWSKLLPLKAKAELPKLEARQAALSAEKPQPGPQGAAKPDPAAVKQQLEGLKASMNKAIELGPQVESLSEEAVVKLRDKKAEEALPKQEQALKLLKEIADPLPKQDQSGQDPKKQDGQQKKQQRKPRDLSREQAQSVLRRAREREAKHRDMQKEIQRYLAGPSRVDKDW